MSDKQTPSESLPIPDAVNEELYESVTIIEGADSQDEILREVEHVWREGFTHGYGAANLGAHRMGHELARLDADKTATGKTRLVARVHDVPGDTSVAIVPGPADTYVAEDGTRIPLTSEDKEQPLEALQAWFAKEQAAGNVRTPEEIAAGRASTLTVAELREWFQKWCPLYASDGDAWDSLHYLVFRTAEGKDKP